MPAKKATVFPPGRIMGSISESWISAISKSRQVSLNELEADTEAAIQSDAKSTQDYLKNKQLELSLRKAHTKELSHGLQEAFKEGRLKETELKSADKTLKRKHDDYEAESVKVEMSGRTLCQDITSLVQANHQLADAYRHMVTCAVFPSLHGRDKGEMKKLEKQQIKAAKQQAKQTSGTKKELELYMGIDGVSEDPSKKPLVQRSAATIMKAFKTEAKAVYDCYKPKDTKSGQPAQSWCVITADWWDDKVVKMAHIVSREFQDRQGDLSHLFGDKAEGLAKDWRNGLPLLHTLEEYFDNGEISIVPVGDPVDDRPMEWRVIVINKDLLPLCFSNGRKWREIDGKQLTFRNNYRPAARYLYWKYVVTYIMWESRGYTEWATRLGEHRDYIWASPGSFVSKPLLYHLRVGMDERRLPEALYNNQAFDEDEYSEKHVDLVARSLAVAIRGKLAMRGRAAKKLKRATEEDEDEDSENEDSEDDDNEDDEDEDDDNDE